MTNDELVALALTLADRLDANGGPASAGLVRQLARRLSGHTPGGCEHCGGPVTQPATGRPARFCSDRCRYRYRYHRTKRARSEP